MSGKEKENTPLQQATLNFGATAASGNAKRKAASMGKKRTLTVTGNFEVNLNDTNIPATKEVVEAMRKRILELEEQLDSQSSAKRTKLSNNTEEEPAAGSSASASAKPSKPKADPKKIEAIIKKIWSSLQKEVKTEKNKFKGGPARTCRIEEVIEEDEFVAIFIGRVDFVKIIQPLPDNKPNSSVHIYEYSAEDIQKLFGKYYKELKGNGYSIGGPFSKSVKIGLVPLNINALQVSYSMNTMKCAMKFEVEEAEPHPAIRSYGWFLE